MEEYILVPVDKMPPRRSYVIGKYQKIVNEFVGMKDSICYVEFENHINARNASLGFKRYIKKTKLKITIQKFENRVYFEKIVDG